MAGVLDDEAVDRRCPDGWRREGDEGVRVYPSDGYPDGVTFATRVAEVADEQLHHPEFVIRYDEVEDPTDRPRSGWRHGRRHPTGRPVQRGAVTGLRTRRRIGS